MKEYKAFISYRHADNTEQGRQWATWLHQAIETYDVPSELVGKKNERNEVIPERIFPIFRDEEELPANADLATSITDALNSTQILIVLCSPNAVASTYVADEIDYFKKLGHSERIIAALIDGEPNSSWDQAKQQSEFTSADECFPKPLQFKYDQNGKPTDNRAEPIAADFRIHNNGKSEQGWTTTEAYRQHLKRSKTVSGKEISKKINSYHQQHHLMLLKIIASILGVPLAELTQRDKEYQLEIERNKAKRLKQWIAAIGFLLVISIGLGVFAFTQKQAAQAQEQRAVAQTKELLRSKSLTIPQIEELYGIDEAIKFAFETIQDNPDLVPDSFERYLNSAYQRTQPLNEVLEKITLNHPFTWRNKTYIKTKLGLAKLSEHSSFRYFVGGPNIFFIDNLQHTFYFKPETNESIIYNAQSYETPQIDYSTEKERDDNIYKFKNYLIIPDTYVSDTFRRNEQIRVFDTNSYLMDYFVPFSHKNELILVPECNKQTLSDISAIYQNNKNCLSPLDNFPVLNLDFPAANNEINAWQIQKNNKNNINEKLNFSQNHKNTKSSENKIDLELEEVLTTTDLRDWSFGHQLFRFKDSYTLIYHSAQGKFRGTHFCKLNKDKQFVGIELNTANTQLNEEYFLDDDICRLEIQAGSSGSYTSKQKKFLLIVTDVIVNATPFQIWDLESTKELTPKKFPLSVSNSSERSLIEFSPSEDLLTVVGNSNNIWLYKKNTVHGFQFSKLIDSFNDSIITSIHFINENRLLISTFENTNHLYDISLNKIIWSNSLFKNRELNWDPERYDDLKYRPYSTQELLSTNLVLSQNKTIALKMNQGNFQLFDVTNGAKLSNVMSVFDRFPDNNFLKERHYISDAKISDDGSASLSISTKQGHSVIALSRLAQKYELHDKELFHLHSGYEFLDSYKKTVQLKAISPVMEKQIEPGLNDIFEDKPNLNNHYETSKIARKMALMIGPQWCLQLGSFSTSELANEFTSKLAAVSNNISVIQDQASNQFQVLLGPEENKSTFSDTMSTLKELAIPFWLRPCPGSKNESEVKSDVPPAQEYWKWPLEYPYYYEYDTEQGYIELNSNNDEYVNPVAEGKVVYVGNALTRYENLIIIKHSDDFMTVYFHNDEILVKEGDKVTPMLPIAKTKHIDGIYTMRFEIRYQGKTVNPLNILK